MKAISYIRVSTIKQGQSGLGLEAQRAIIQYFYPNIEREYLEVKSAKDVENRPILQEAIKYCIENDALLVVAKVDRLSRNAELGLKIHRELDGRLRSCDIPNVPDKFMLTLMFAFGEREKELISIRTKAALARSKKAKGTQSPTGNRKAWGTKQHDESLRVRQLRAMNNPDRGKARELAIALKDSSTLEQIADKLNSSGFATLSGQGKWNKGSIHRLIK